MNLEEIAEAAKSGSVIAYVDNDNISFYDGDEHLASLPPYIVMESALTMLGISPLPV